MTRQRFRSQYGRPTITVTAECPTHAIKYLLGRTHVGTPAAEVEQDIRERAAGRRSEGETKWSTSAENTAVRFALWQHAENLAAYHYVMGGATSRSEVAPRVAQQPAGRS